MKKRRSIILLILFCLILIAAVCGYFALSYDRNNMDVCNIIEHYFNGEVRSGTYRIDSIKRTDPYLFSVVRFEPDNGEGRIYLFALERRGGELSIVHVENVEESKSIGVAVYKISLGGRIVVFGSVEDKVWKKFDSPAEKVNFTKVKVIYNDTEEKATEIGNFQAFMIVVEDNVQVNEVTFLSDDKVVANLSELPISTMVLE